MKTILLHVGTHKTGSTSLQRSFFEHREALKDNGIAYLGGDGAYEHLYSAFMNNPMHFEWNVLSHQPEEEIRARDAAVREELGNQIAQTPCETVIISSEYLSKLDVAEQTAMKTFLEPYGRVIAVYYYRELLSWMSSDSQQLAKVGMRRQPTEFSTAIERVYDMPLRVHEVFGAQNTRFIRFEDAVKTGICNTFLETFGLPTLASMGLEEVYANESISANAVRAMFVYNRLFPLGSGTRQPKVAARLRALAGPKYELEGLTEEQIAEYAEKRAHVASALGLRLKDPAEIPVGDVPDPMTQELLKMINRFLAMKEKEAGE